MTDSTKPSIAIVAHFAYGAMSGGATGHIGGVERQTSLTARWLTEQGYPVSLITWDEGQVDGEVVDGVRLIKMCRQDAGIPGLRFFHPRWSSLNQALARADADVYYQNCAEYVTGQVAMWCKRHNKRFVYTIANDPDVDPKLPDMHTIRERVLYRHGLRRADEIVVQTQTQRQTLLDGFGLDSKVIPMPCPDLLKENESLPAAPESTKQSILWIARLCKQKRPDRYLDLAEACPEFQFDLVGPYGDDEYCSEVIHRSKSIPNVKVWGGIERAKVGKMYRSAACLCSTSDFEGFPNTFLEAWSLGIPLVTTFDPDGLVAAKNLGRTAGDVETLAAGLREILGSPDAWLEASRNARSYYENNHTVEAVLPRFEAVFFDRQMPRHAEAGKVLHA